MLEDKDRAQLLYFVCQILPDPTNIDKVKEMFESYLSIIEA